MGSARQKATEMRQIELSKKKIPSFLHTSAHRKRRRPCSLPHAWVQQQLHDMVSSLSRAGGSGVLSPTVVWVGGSKRGGRRKGVRYGIPGEQERSGCTVVRMSQLFFIKIAMVL